MPPYYCRNRELDLDIERAYLRAALLSSRTLSSNLIPSYPFNYYPYLPPYYYNALPPYYGALPPYPYFY